MKKFLVVSACMALFSGVASADVLTSGSNSSAQQGVQVEVLNSNGGSGSDHETLTQKGYLLTAPPVYAPSLAATAPCLGSQSTGGSTIFGGVTHANTKQDWGCERRSDAAAAQHLGHDDVATNIMCLSVTYRMADKFSKTPSCDPKMPIQTEDGEFQSFDGKEYYKTADVK